jgi:hypothetical protein
VFVCHGTGCSPSPPRKRCCGNITRTRGARGNLAVGQQFWWSPDSTSAPGYLAQCRQLTAARAERDRLRAGSQIIQQALRDFAQAMANFVAGTHGRPV